MFSHLHCHSHYSILDGLGTVEEIVKRAKETGAPAACITDHGSLSSFPDLMKVCKAEGIKPIIGCEFYVVDSLENDVDEDGKKKKHQTRYHLTVLAKNWAGMQSLMRQLTIANQQFYYKPRITFDQALEFTDCIVMSGCCQGILAHENWKAICRSFQSAYGSDFYLEIQPHEIRETPDSVDLQRVTNARAYTLWQSEHYKVVATNDAHYVWEEDAYTHEVLLAIQTKKTWHDPKRMKFSCNGFHMRDLNEMFASFKKHCSYLPGDMVKASLVATAEIVKKVSIEKPETPIEFPTPYEGESDIEVFGRKIREGWKRKIEGKVTDPITYGKRLAHEIDVIRKLNFVRYFLMVEDMIREARSRDIMVGPGRGSSAGSLVCYLLDITQLDPIEHELYFERFLNIERLDFPDIDTDYEKERRDEIFEYIREKYGHDYTAQITTFGELTLKVAYTDVCRVFGINGVSLKNIDIPDEETFDAVPGMSSFAKTEEGAKVISLAKKLAGRIRQSGIHASGVVISARPITDVAVIERRGDDGKTVFVVNWDMRECEKFGLIKVDILGLSTLSILANANKLIHAQSSARIDFNSVSLADSKSMHAFSIADTIAIFQFENPGMQTLMKGLKASDFPTITATTALYRPGPLNSGLAERFLQIAQGNEYEKYPSERLRPILSPTKSIMVYQEQVMRIAVELAGFTWTGADKLRKIIGKKLGTEEFEKHRDSFVEGCLKNGVDSGIANTIFSQMVEFSGYAFNRSHAVAYTLISLWCQYTKQHHMTEFMAASMTSANSDTTDKKKLSVLMREARKKGIEVLQPDINTSKESYMVVVDELTGKKSIRAPLQAIKGVGAAAITAIMEARSSGPFTSLLDFENRINKRAVNSGTRSTLVRAGAFETLGEREWDEEKRIKEFSALMPSFAIVPVIAMGDKMLKEQMDMIGELLADVTACQAVSRPKGFVLQPKFKQKSTIMVINNPVKNELTHWTSDGSKYFLKTMKGLGFTEGDFYYTSPVKCFHDNYQKVSEECTLKCEGFLKREIELVRPKLIICFASSCAPLLTGDAKAKGNKLTNQVVFSRAFDTYIVFSPSPQYAYWREEVREGFLESMALVRQIFS